MIADKSLQTASLACGSLTRRPILPESRWRWIGRRQKIGYETGCPDDKGKVAVRTKPQSICPREWTTRQAMNAIREAIKRGHISASWTSDGRYPRHVWHKEGDIWYHAMTGNGDDGVYHGYQEEIRNIPLGLGR